MASRGHRPESASGPEDPSAPGRPPRLAPLPLLVESLPWAAVVEDAACTVLAANRRFCEIFLPSVSPDEVIGLTREELWLRAARSLADPSEYPAELGRRVREGRPVTAEPVRLARSRTALRDYLPLPGEGGEPALHLWLYADVTTARRVEAERQRTENLEAIARLAGGIAHDLNNALTAILGHASLLELEFGRRPDLLESVSEIHGAAQRSAALTRELLAFGGRQVLQPKEIDAAEVVRRVQDVIGRVLGAGIELVVELPDEPALVRVDASKLERALLDLSVNARDSMPEGGRLVISLDYGEIPEDERPDLQAAADPSGRFAIVSVTDTGGGIPEEMRSRVFEPFFSARAPHRRQGLGLASVYGFIRQSGGHVWIPSAGRGATIRVALPLDPRPAST